MPGPLQSARALRLHRPLCGRHAVHRLCARPACARTDAQQRPWRKVHRGPASGAAGVSGSVPVGGEGAGTRVRSEATYSRAEGRAGRQRETTPPLNQHFQRHCEANCCVGVGDHHVRLGSQLANALHRIYLLAAAAIRRHIRPMACGSVSPCSRANERHVPKVSAWPTAACTRRRAGPRTPLPLMSVSRAAVR